MGVIFGGERPVVTVPAWGGCTGASIPGSSPPAAILSARMPCPARNCCSNCGAKLVLRVPPSDSLPRHVCDNCNTIHYRNPLVVVGTIPEWEDWILLCRRAIEPRRGLWTLPAGFMELGETTAQAALRETMEEAKARVELGEVFALLSVPHVDQVHVFYR